MEKESGKSESERERACKREQKKVRDREEERKEAGDSKKVEKKDSPARLPASREAPVHDVVGDQKEGLEPLDAPAQGVCLEPGVRGKSGDGLRHRRRRRGAGRHDRGDGVGDGEPAVELAARNVEVEHPAGVGRGEIGLGAQERVRDELIAELGVDGEEFLRRKKGEGGVERERERQREKG